MIRLTLGLLLVVAMCHCAPKELEDIAGGTKDGYEEFPGLGYYKLHIEEKHFLDALAICEREGAHLLILNSDDEFEAMKTLLRRMPADIMGAWIGFHDFYEEGRYETVLGESLESTGFTKWQPGNPDNWKNEDCGMLTISGLNDAWCSIAYAVICERYG